MTREQHVGVLKILMYGIMGDLFPNENRTAASIIIRKMAVAIHAYAKLFQFESPITTFSDWLFRIYNQLMALSSDCVAYARNEQGHTVALLISDSMLSSRLTEILMELYNPPYGCSYKE